MVKVVWRGEGSGRSMMFRGIGIKYFGVMFLKYDSDQGKKNSKVESILSALSMPFLDLVKCVMCTGFQGLCTLL